MGVYFYHTGGDKELVFVEDKSLLPSEGEVNKLYVVRKGEDEKESLYLWNHTKKTYQPISGGSPSQVIDGIRFGRTSW